MGEFVQIKKTVALALALGIGTAACGGEDSAYCLSPRSTSRVYAGDAAADPKDQSTWHSGIEVETVTPADTEGLIVGFSGPSEQNWRDSKPMLPDKADSVALRIGHGDVVFSTRIIADVGSAICEIHPESTFGEREAYDDILKRRAAPPEWP